MSGFSLHVRTILLAGFCGLSGVGIGLALLLGLSTAIQNTQELVASNVEGLVDRMAYEVEVRLRPVEERSQWIASQIKDGQVDVNLPISQNTEYFFQTVLSTTPGTRAIGLLTRDGQSMGWAKGSPTTFRQDRSQDTPIMDWVRSGESNPVSEWGPPIWLEELNEAAIVYQAPVHDAAGYLGYLTYYLSIADFSEFLSDVDENAFILYGDDQVLAHPLMVNWQPADEAALPSPSAVYGGQSALMRLPELGDPVLQMFGQADAMEFARGNSSESDGFKARASTVEGKLYVYLYREIFGFGAKPLTVGTYVEADTADDVYDRLGIAAVLGGIVLVVAVGLGLFVAREIGRPIRAISDASSILEAGELNRIPDLPRSRVFELNQAMSSFESMVQGLAEKEVIRRTLGRYVPASIAEQLLKDDGTLQPVEAKATILFCDVAGFTKLTEELGPIRIVEVLNAFFSRMTQIIEAEGGVITQFQGDAILAIFNVPIESAEHAECACRAAIKMRQCVHQETFVGKQIRFRIGINTGFVVAGAVGAEDRLTYTVYGDAVNLAARVEPMNKETGTEILITEATAQSVHSLALREVGIMEVRGQTEAVRTFTIDD